MEKGIILKTEKTEGFIFKEEPIDNTEQDENDGEPIQKKRKIENQMIDYQNTIPTLELIQAMFFKFIFTGFFIYRVNSLGLSVSKIFSDITLYSIFGVNSRPKNNESGVRFYVKLLDYLRGLLSLETIFRNY